MPTYTQRVTTAPLASGDGERTFELPKLLMPQTTKQPAAKAKPRGRSPHRGWRTVGQH
jgi:hypothetical protein